MMHDETQGDIDSFSGKYDWLSNFFVIPIRMDDDIIYPSAEHAYQAYKSEIEEERDIIRHCFTASKAKRKGQHVTLRKNWSKLKIDVMKDIVRRKFTQNKELGGKLLATGSRKLIEGNHWKDYYWGVCRGRGTNHLGKILVLIRQDLRQHSTETRNFDS